MSLLNLVRLGWYENVQHMSITHSHRELLRLPKKARHRIRNIYKIDNVRQKPQTNDKKFEVRWRKMVNFIGGQTQRNKLKRFILFSVRNVVEL